MARETPGVPTRSRAEVPAPPRSPVVSAEPDRPRPARDTGDDPDPGAIIDYVLRRGKQRD